MTKRSGWIVIITVNAAILLAALYYLLHVTDAYIAQKRERTIIYDIHSLRRQAPLPNQSCRIGSAGYTINQYGIRGRAPDVPRPEGVFRIMAMGGSAAFDYLVGEGNSWPEMLAKLLQDDVTLQVESFNAGVNGYSSRETLAFYHDKIRFLEPDMVIFYHGWNDVKYMDMFKEQVDVDSFFYVKSWREKYRFLTAPRPLRNWYALPLMIRERFDDSAALPENRSPAKKKNPGKKTARAGSPGLAWAARAAAPPSRAASAPGLMQHWAQTPGMLYFEKNVEAFVHAVLSDGALPVLVAQNTLAAPDTAEADRKKITYKWVNLDHENLLAVNEAMVAALKAVAARNDIPCIDLRGELNGNRDNFADHVHMRPRGSRRFAYLLAEKLSPLLASRCTGHTVARKKKQRTGMLTAHWVFDKIIYGTVADIGPFNMPGTLAGGVSAAPDGAVNGCLEFDGKDGEVIVPDNNYLNLGAKFIISAWVRLDEPVTRPSMGIAVKGGEYHLALRGGKPAFFGYGLSPQKWYVAARPVPLNTWVDISVVYDGTVLKIVMAGEEVCSAEAGGSLLTTSRPLKIGSANGFFKGKIDEVKLEVLP